MITLKENLNEILLAYYIFSFTLLARIMPNYTKISTIVLSVNIILIITISLIYNKMKIKFTVQEIIIYLVVILYALIDYNFRFNIYTVQTYTYMIIFAIVPIFLYLRIGKLDAFFSSYVFFSIVVAILFLLDPINNYEYSGDYMGFGYNVMMLAYIGIYMIAREKKGILLKALLGIVLVEMVLFSNKGAILSIILFMAMYELFVKEGTTKKMIIIAVGIVIILSFNMIIESIYDITINNNIASYSLETLHQMVNKKSSGLSGRENIWREAQEQIKNNILLGNGAGHYRASNTEGLYTHNIVYDVLIEYGIFVFGVLCALVLKGILKIKKEKGKSRLLGIVFLIMWFPKLFFSSYFQADMGFWLFIIWGLVDKKIVQGEKNESKEFNY